MRIAVISDPHANLPALTATLADIDRHQPDVIWCLGDLVGYGPHPAAVVATVLERCDLVLAGNHDLWARAIADDVIGDHGYLDRALRLAVNELQGAGLWEAHGQLRPHAFRDGIRCVHAHPADPMMRFLAEETDAQDAFDATDAQTVLFGHTHRAIAWRQIDGWDVAAHTGPQTVSEDRWALNPGAVGRPQQTHGVPVGRSATAQDDPRAAWALLDRDTGNWTPHLIEYDRTSLTRDLRRVNLHAATF